MPSVRACSRRWRRAEPTASAVVADIIDVVRTLTADPDNRVPHLAFQPDALSDLPVLPMAEAETCYHLRLQAVTAPACWPTSPSILADRDISIEAVLQKNRRPAPATCRSSRVDLPGAESNG